MNLFENLLNMSSIDSTSRCKNLKESAKGILKEYNPNITNKDQLFSAMLKYTEEPLVTFNDLFNCYSIDDLQDLYDYLSSEYEDDEFPVYRGKINNKDEMWNAMNELILPHEQQVGFDDLFNCYSLDKLKDLYDFLSSEYSYLDDYDEEFESKQLNESNNIVDDRKRMEYIVDIVNSLDDHLNTVNEISESLSKKIGKLYKMCSFLESIDEIKESTSGISGAYTTKAIDMTPTKFKKPKEVKEDITKFYDEKFDDEEIKIKIEYTKEHPEDFNVPEYLDNINYEDNILYLISDAKDIVFDGKDCTVRYAVDEDLNKYLVYYELVDSPIDSEVIYKVVAL